MRVIKCLTLSIIKFYYVMSRFKKAHFRSNFNVYRQGGVPQIFATPKKQNLKFEYAWCFIKENVTTKASITSFLMKLISERKDTRHKLDQPLKGINLCVRPLGSTSLLIKDSEYVH